MEARGESPRIPPVSARHVAEWWLEIGPTSGEGAVTWQDMAAWERITGIELEPWEARAIRAMSVAFRSEQYAARKKDCPAPYSGEMEEIISRRDEVAAKVKAAFRANLQGKPKGGK